MGDIYQHFRPEEKEFIDKVLEWKRQVIEMYAPRLTGFLDPREQQIVYSAIGSAEDVRVSFFGGHPMAERKRALIHPDYFTPDQTDYAVDLFEIDYPEKFASISHPKILGSVMGLGLKREKFGDILNEGTQFQLFAAQEISDYMLLHLDQIGKVPVKLKKRSYAEAIQAMEEWQTLQVTVSSMRLDAVIGALSSMSRQKAQLLIKSGAVKVNWKAVEQTSFECAEGDMISARGVGRMKILSVDGQTKKEKWRMTLGILK